MKMYYDYSVTIIFNSSQSTPGLYTASLPKEAVARLGKNVYIISSSKASKEEPRLQLLTRAEWEAMHNRLKKQYLMGPEEAYAEALRRLDENAVKCRLTGKKLTIPASLAEKVGVEQRARLYCTADGWFIERACLIPGSMAAEFAWLGEYLRTRDWQDIGHGIQYYRKEKSE